MDALSLYRAGHLRQAIAALGEELKKSPLDTKRRTFLFELLCFAGEYDRAEKHLDFLSGSNQDAAAGALFYRSALHAERTRRDMFLAGSLPLESGITGAKPGKVNGESVALVRDADPRIGFNLEVFIAGSYTWIPFSSLEEVVLEKPTRLRDLLWIPARIHTTPNFRLQDLGEVLLPVLSPLSSAVQDESVALGRQTIWVEDEKYGSVPLGQKLFACDDEDVPLLQVRRMSWTAAQALHTPENPLAVA